MPSRAGREMSAHDYNETHIVEQPAVALLAELGWQAANAMEEKFGPTGTLGRDTSSAARKPR